MDFKPNTSAALWTNLANNLTNGDRGWPLLPSGFTNGINQTAAVRRHGFRVESIRGADEPRGAERFRVTTTVSTRPYSHRGKYTPLKHTRRHTHRHTHTHAPTYIHTRMHRNEIKTCGQPWRNRHVQTHKVLASWTWTKPVIITAMAKVQWHTLARTQTHTHTSMHLPGQGAWVAVGTRALRENAKLDRELHDFMPLREFTQPNVSPSPSLSASLSLSSLNVSRPGSVPRLSSFVARCTDASSLGHCWSLSGLTERETKRGGGRAEGRTYPAAGNMSLPRDC